MPSAKMYIFHTKFWNEIFEDPKMYIFHLNPIQTGGGQFLPTPLKINPIQTGVAVRILKTGGGLLRPSLVNIKLDVLATQFQFV